MNNLKSLFAFLFLLVATLFTASDAQAFAPGNHAVGFFLGTLDCAGSENPGTRNPCRENGWLNYDTLSGYVVAAKTGPSRQTTILGENMGQRVIPFAENTGSRHLPFGASKAEWDAMTPKQRWKLNDGTLRARINEGDNFRYIGIDPKRSPVDRSRFDLTGSELLRLNERGVPYQVVSPQEVMSTIGRP